MVTPSERQAETPLVPRYVHRLALTQYERGRQLALAGRLIEVDRGDVETLAEAARTDARLTWRPHFDSSNNPHDQVLLTRRSEVDRALNQIVKAEQFLLHDSSEAQLQAESARAAIRRPVIPIALLAALMAVFAVSVAPTFHDSIFFTLSDEFLVWFCSFVVGGVVGVAVVLAIFTASRLVPDQGMERGVFVGGIVVAIGLATLRVANARAADELALAVGLMAIEIGIVVCADAVATRFRKAQALAEAAETEADRAGRSADALRAFLNEGQRRKRELAAARENLDAEIAERSHPSIEVTELEALAVKAAYSGYRGAIAENVGRMARTGGAS